MSDELGCDYQVYALSAGNTTMLSGVDGAYILLVYSGIGLVNTRRLFQRSPSQHGDTDIGFRTDARVINLVWGITGGDERPYRTLEQARQELLSIFRPREYDPVSLLFITVGGLRRQIDVNLTGDIDNSSSGYDGLYEQRIAVQLKASDPRFYDPRRQSLSFNLLGLSGGWNIEEDGEITSDGWSIEEDGQATSDGWNIGVGSIGITQVLAYGDGSPLPAIEYPVIELTGPIADVIICNNTTNEVLDFTANGGLSIPVGGSVVIDLSVGKKTVIDSNGVFADQYLTSDSDLSAFHLSYESELLFDGSRSTGNNVISVAGSGVTLATSVDILWHNRYIGI